MSLFSPNFLRTSLAEEKRRLEGRLATMEEDLEEEQMNYEAAVDKARKAQEQLDSMSGEVTQYQSNISKLESTKSQLEKQVRGSFVPNYSGYNHVHFLSLSVP